MIHLKPFLTLFVLSSEFSTLQRPDELPMHIRHIQYYLLLVVDEFRRFDHLFTRRATTRASWSIFRGSISNEISNERAWTTYGVLVLALDEAEFFFGGMLRDKIIEGSNCTECRLRYRNKIWRAPSDVRCDNQQNTHCIYIGQTIL